MFLTSFPLWLALVYLVAEAMVMILQEGNGWQGRVGWDLVPRNEGACL